LPLPVADAGTPKRGRNTERGNRSKGSRATMFLTEAQRIRNAQVVGSSPTISSKHQSIYRLVLFNSRSGTVVAQLI